MLSDPRFLLAAPCLSGLASSYQQKKASCSRCKAKLRKLVSDTTIAAKNCLSSLPADKRAEVKRLLNARQVRLIKTNAKGQRVQITF
jgi:hypothetical protein